jgi:hypothetical protein
MGQKFLNEAIIGQLVLSNLRLYHDIDVLVQTQSFKGLGKELAGDI